MIFFIREVKGETDCDIIMFCWDTFLAMIQHSDSGRQGGAGAILVMWSDMRSDSEWLFLILGPPPPDCADILSFVSVCSVNNDPKEIIQHLNITTNPPNIFPKTAQEQPEKREKDHEVFTWV